MNNITAYFSHSIRGKEGKAATFEYMSANCRKAKKVSDWIRENIPDLELYVPAEHEEFIQMACVRGDLTEKQILDIDCKILSRRDMLIVLEQDGWHGGGIGIEICYAQDVAKIPIFYLCDADQFTLNRLKRFVEAIRKEK